MPQITPALASYLASNRAPKIAAPAPVIKVAPTPAPEPSPRKRSQVAKVKGHKPSFPRWSFPPSTASTIRPFMDGDIEKVHCNLCRKAIRLHDWWNHGCTFDGSPL